MYDLQLFLFGQPEIRVQNEIVTNSISKKSQALIYYLAITKEESSRQHLASLLWPEYPEQRSRNNLRVELSRLSTEIRQHLDVKRHSIDIARKSSYWVDIEQFDLLAQAPNALVDLEKAISLYRGDILEGFYLSNSTAFDYWITIERENNRRRVLSVAEKLSLQYVENRQYSLAMNHLRRMISIESYLEWAHRQLMLLLALTGQRKEALEQYKACEEILREELGVEPSNATKEVYKNIIKGEIEALKAETVELIPTDSGKPLNETKLLVVGQGAVGKTSLINRIIDDKFNPNSKKTEGIIILSHFMVVSLLSVVNDGNRYF